MAPGRPDVVTLTTTVMADVVASQLSVRDLKTHLSEWLARAQSGEVVEVTSHRKPIACITAVKPVAPAQRHRPGAEHRYRIELSGPDLGSVAEGHHTDHQPPNAPVRVSHELEEEAAEIVPVNWERRKNKKYDFSLVFFPTNS